MNRLRLVLLLTLAVAGHLHADDVDTALKANALAVDHIVKTADKIRDDLAVIQAETELNHLDQPAGAPLAGFSETLGELRDTQVAAVVTTLKLAEAAPDDAARRTALVATFTRQKALELALHYTAAEFSPAEAQAHLLKNAAALLARQMTNSRQTSLLATFADNPEALAGAPARRHDIVAVEQAALEQEILILADTSGKTPPDWADGNPYATTARVVKETLVRTALLPAAHTATTDTRRAPLISAFISQKQVEDKLSRMLDDTIACMPSRQIGAEAAPLLKQLLADERALRSDTAGAKTDNATLAERQARLAERTEVLSRLLAAIDPEAADHIKSACKKMGEARAGLKPGADPGGALPAEDDAIALLGQAGKMLAGTPGEGDSEGEGPPGGTVGEEDNESENEADGKGPNPRSSGEGDPTRSALNNPPHPSDEAGLPAANALVLGPLARKEREALSSTETEKILPQYAPLVEQYLRSLSAPATPPERP